MDEYKTARSRIGNERTHYQTGWLIIDIPPERTTMAEARSFSEKIISDLHLVGSPIKNFINCWLDMRLHAAIYSDSS